MCSSSSNNNLYRLLTLFNATPVVHMCTGVLYLVKSSENKDIPVPTVYKNCLLARPVVQIYAKLWTIVQSSEQYVGATTVYVNLQIRDTICKLAVKKLHGFKSPLENLVVNIMLYFHKIS